MREIGWAFLQEDVLDEAAHAEASSGLDDPEHGLDGLVRSWHAPRTFAPSLLGEEQAASHVVAGHERDSQLAGQREAECRLPASRLAREQNNSRPVVLRSCRGEDVRGSADRWRGV